MDALKSSDTDWNDDLFVEATPAPGVAVEMLEELPSMTVATIVGVTIAVLVTIVAVFILGILLDCRQQRLLDQKMEQMRRTRNQRNKTGDGHCIINNMEETAESVPPAEMVISNVP